MLDEAGFRPEAKVNVLKAKERFRSYLGAGNAGL